MSKRDILWIMDKSSAILTAGLAKGTIVDYGLI
jgi:hypothetical protein